MTHEAPSAHPVAPLVSPQAEVAAAAHTSKPLRRESVRPVFLGFILAMALGLGGVIAVAVVVSVMLASQGVGQTEIPKRFESDPLLILLMVFPFQVAIVAVACFMARRTRRPMLPELGLVGPALGAKGWLVILLGTGVPLAAGMGLASLVPSISGEGVVELWKNLTPAMAVFWVLGIGLGPGISEELFFRGFVQRRLCRAWRPTTAILVTSALFALVHIDPPTAMLALVLGAWLGFVAWRTGSTLPGMAAHATVNSLWNVGQIVVRQTEPATGLLIAVLSVIGAVSLACFVGAILLLHKRRPTTEAPGAVRRRKE